MAAGCVERPIREVWAVLLNTNTEKPENVDEYTVTPRPDLDNPALDLFFAYDIVSQHNVPLINPSWTDRWYYFIPQDSSGHFLGTYEDPWEVGVRFQKVDGTSYITSQSGAFLLDRVTADVTGYMMVEDVNASQYDASNGAHDVQVDLDRARTFPANWDVLTPHYTKQ
jgi:hypothetical protein